MTFFGRIQYWLNLRHSSAGVRVRLSYARRIRILGSLILGFLLFADELPAAQPTGSSTRSAPEHPVLRDTKRVLRARQALFEDPLLAPYNLSVEVRAGVATLSGALPSAELVWRAQDRVSKLGLFNDVRSELVVDATCNSPTQLPTVAPSGPEDVLTSIANPKPRAPSELTGRNEPPARVPVLKPPEPISPANNAATPSRPLDEAVTLLPPRPIAASTAPSGIGAEILLPRPLVAKEPTEAVEKLRRSEVRFQSLQVSVREGVVTVRGPASGDEMYAFAQAVRLLPGVVRVVLQSAP
jgi:hypothetical protein